MVGNIRCFYLDKCITLSLISLGVIVAVGSNHPLSDELFSQNYFLMYCATVVVAAETSCGAQQRHTAKLHDDQCNGLMVRPAIHKWKTTATHNHHHHQQGVTMKIGPVKGVVIDNPPTLFLFFPLSWYEWYACHLTTIESSANLLHNFWLPWWQPFGGWKGMKPLLPIMQHWRGKTAKASSCSSHYFILAYTPSTTTTLSPLLFLTWTVKLCRTISLISANKWHIYVTNFGGRETQ